MAFIDKLEVCNFKAFYGTETINFEGKHLLMYGENGSGKSSIYWAIYTLFQSALKKPSEVKKYFNPGNSENLINRFHLKDKAQELEVDEDKININFINSYIQITLSNDEKFKIDYKGLIKILDDGQESREMDTVLKLNRYSDFINHRMLSNFYNFKNSEEINLWELFVQNVFPSLYKEDSEDSLYRKLKALLNSEAPYDLTKGDGRLRLKRNFPAEFQSKIDEFNEEASHWLDEINGYINDFFIKHFKEKEESEFLITLQLKEPLKFQKIFEQSFKGNRREFEKVGFNIPKISLKVEMKPKDSEEYIIIKRPQSFINEAKLTRIALAVRFVLLLKYIRPDDEDKHLFLDDLLISLDMSNRSKVLDIILGKFSSKYKIIFFTHERSFFNMIKDRLEYSDQKEKWNIKELYLKNKTENISVPTLFDSESHISRALKYKNDIPFDYAASANYLRKELENIFEKYLPKEIFKNDNGTPKERLSDKMNAVFRFYENLFLDLNLLYKIKTGINTLLNPMSHHDVDSEIYRIEIDQISDSIIDLRSDLENLKNNVKKILPRGTELIVKLPVENNVENIYEMVVNEDIYIYFPENNEITLSQFSLEKNVCCYEIQNEEEGKKYNITINVEQRKSMNSFLKLTCEKKNLSIDMDDSSQYISIRRKEGNKELKELIREISL